MVGCTCVCACVLGSLRHSNLNFPPSGGLSCSSNAWNIVSPPTLSHTHTHSETERDLCISKSPFQCWTSVRTRARGTPVKQHVHHQHSCSCVSPCVCISAWQAGANHRRHYHAHAEPGEPYCTASEFNHALGFISGVLCQTLNIL